MGKYILSLDQGTTSARAIVFDKNGRVVSAEKKEITQYFPKAGWVEHDAAEILEFQIEVARKAIKENGINEKDIAGIGITNQRETVVVWDRHTGKPIYNAIVWQDKRTSSFCEQLIKEGKKQLIKEKTGLIIDSYFSASKIKWILDNVENARERAKSGDLIFGTIDTWLIYNLTEGKLHITDSSNASRTCLFNIKTNQWDDELLDLFSIPKEMLPTVKSSSEVYGFTNLIASDKTQIPISGIAGDQQSALFGQMCLEKGMVKNTYGTGCFMLMNTGDNLIDSKNNLLSTIAWEIDGKISYALEGSVFISGAVVQWLRDGLKIIKDSSEIEELALSVGSSDGVYFVPAFSGLGTPFWNQNAKGTLFGITRGTTDAHIARASLEATAFQTMDVLVAMEADSGIKIKELRVDGGASVNDFLMQFQSDVLNTTVVRPSLLETTAMGAAFLSGLAVGFWKNTEELQSILQIDTHFSATKDRTEVENKIKGWHKAVDALQYWSKST